jgi:hypothetical protein
MYIDANGHVIITDEYMCSFFKRNSSLMESFETVIKTMCIACEQKPDTNPDFTSHVKTIESTLHKSVQEMRSDVLKLITSVDSNIERISESGSKKEREHVNETVRFLRENINELKEKIDVSKLIETKLDHERDAIIHTLNFLKANTDDLKTKIDSLAVTRNTNRYKGEQGESGILDLLSQKLMTRDGFEVEDVHSQMNSCDILVKRINFPDVRIECKAYKDRVKTAEVNKFQSDVSRLSCHAIFVSLYSGICGKTNLELEQLANGKFAVYISNNNYDIDTIVEFIHLLYRLDSLTSTDNNGSLSISAESVSRIQTLLSDFTKKLGVIKTHMKSSLNLLNELTFDMVEKIITGNDIQVAIHEPSSFQCKTCMKTFKNLAGLKSHESRCNT